MSAPQRKLIDSKHRRKVTHAGRRGGKTTALEALALQSAVENPGSITPIIEKTLTTQAAETFWKDLQALDEQYSIGGYFQHTVKHYHLPNGSQIHMMGAETKDQADKVRGGKFRRVIIDEAGTYRDSILRYLIEECAEPAVLDYAGDIILGGTPGLLKEGFFYDAAKSGNGWEPHHWTLVDNDALPLNSDMDAAARRAWREAELQAVVDRNAWTWDTPRFVREYLGQWCLDTAGGIFRLEKYNLGGLVGLTRPRYLLSVDVGFEDPCAFVVLAICPNDPHIYVIESEQKQHMPPSVVAAHIERYLRRYPGMTVVMDSGGAGKGYAEEARRVHHIPVLAARKVDKATQIDAMNGDFKTGVVHIVQDANRELIEDVRALPWNEKRTGPESGFDDHLPDALRYGLTQIRAWRDTTTLGQGDAPEKGSPEWWESFEAGLWAEQAEPQAPTYEDGELYLDWDD